MIARLRFDSKYRLEAFDLRQKANDTFQSARTVLGLVILNHVFSAVEARITTKRWNAKQQQTGSLEIDLQTDISTGALTGILVLKKKFLKGETYAISVTTSFGRSKFGHSNPNYSFQKGKKLITLDMLKTLII